VTAHATLQENTMSITVQFLQQSRTAQKTRENNPSGACAKPQIARSFKAARSAKRIYACLPPPKQMTEALAMEADTQATVSMYVPFPGRSVLHKRMHADNLAAIGQVLQQQQIALATGIIAKSRPERPDPGDIEARINDAKYSLIADVSAVTAHLLDKHGVDAGTFLEDKLMSNTAPLISEVRALLSQYDLDAASNTFEAAIDQEAFRRFIAMQDLQSRAVYDEINRRAGYLVATMFLIAVADFGNGIDPGDWPAPPDTTYQGQTPFVQAPFAQAAPQPASPKIAAKRAKKIAAPRSKR
jgi:hypothetical protein